MYYYQKNLFITNPHHMLYIVSTIYINIINSSILFLRFTTRVKHIAHLSASTQVLNNIEIMSLTHIFNIEIVS